jgi:ribosomal protein L31
MFIMVVANLHNFYSKELCKFETLLKNVNKFAHKFELFVIKILDF